MTLPSGNRPRGPTLWMVEKKRLAQQFAWLPSLGTPRQPKAGPLPLRVRLRVGEEVVGGTKAKTVSR
jgi:hypothetical protein